MTEHSESAPSAAQVDRIAQVRARRGQTALQTPSPQNPVQVSELESHLSDATTAPSKRRRKRHVAAGSRIVAAGLGAAAMFGIVGVLGLDQAFGASDPPPTDTPTPEIARPAPPPVQVVIHRIPATTGDPSTAAERDTDRTATTVAPADPIVLTANPVVQTVTVPAPSRGPAPAPTATTSGSS